MGEEVAVKEVGTECLYRSKHLGLGRTLCVLQGGGGQREWSRWAIVDQSNNVHDSNGMFRRGGVGVAVPSIVRKKGVWCGAMRKCAFVFCLRCRKSW